MGLSTLDRPGSRRLGGALVPDGPVIVELQKNRYRRQQHQISKR